MTELTLYEQAVRSRDSRAKALARQVAARLESQYVVTRFNYVPNTLDERNYFMDFVHERLGITCAFHLERMEHPQFETTVCYWLFHDPREAMMIKLAWQDHSG